MTNLNRILGFVSLTAVSLLTSVSGANAGTFTQSASFNPVLEVDAGSGTTSLNFAGLIGPITSVTTTVNLTKCDDPISSTGVCEGSGFSFNEEIVLRLISPDGTTVNLINAGTILGQQPGTTVTFTFDESSLNPIGGNFLVSGTFNPTGNLNDFIGEDGNGNWTLFFEDVGGGDPLSINSFSVTVNTVPEPASTLGLVVIGALGLASKFGKSR